MIRMIIFLSIFFAGLASAADIKAQLIKVVDGDTLHLLVDGERQRIRLAEIDTPEKKQAYGAESTALLKSLISGPEITIRVTGVDRYNRWLAHVYAGTLWLNLALVEQGHAWVYARYATSQALFDAEALARAQRLGLWQLPAVDLMPPWQWRRKQRE